MTMRVTMTQTRMGESGSLLEAASTYTVSREFGAWLVGWRYATDTDGVLSESDIDIKTYTVTSTKFAELVAASQLVIDQLYRVGAVIYRATSPTGYETLGAGSDGSTTFEDVATTTYTATAEDFASDGTAKTKRFTNAAGCLVTVPAGLALTAGMVMKWIQASGAGQVTFQGDGVTSNVTSASGDLVSAGELSSGYVEAQPTTDNFLLVGQIGTPRIVQNSKSAAYELVLSDAGKHLLHPSADTTARTFTIPANSAVAFPVGTVVTFINQASAGVLTIAITTDTMRLAGAGTTGSRTLAANGIATAIKVTSTEWIISGTGLT